jgi:hypothetical protein
MSRPDHPRVTVRLTIEMEFTGRKVPGFTTITRAALDQVKGLRVVNQTGELHADRVSVGVDIPDALPGAPGRAYKKRSTS